MTGEGRMERRMMAFNTREERAGNTLGHRIMVKHSDFTLTKSWKSLEDSEPQSNTVLLTF